MLNDMLPRLFIALDPKGSTVPQLVDLLAASPRTGAIQLGIALNKLVDLNPHLAAVHRPRVAEMLAHPSSSSRLNAAAVLARWPGAKDPAALPVLVDALAMERLRDPRAYEPFRSSGGSLPSREGLKFEDENARLQAVQALAEMGAAAGSAVPLLTEFADLTKANNQDYLSEFALTAVSKIDPEARHNSEALDAALRSQERALELLEKAQSGTASFAELEEGLRTKKSADFAARALAGHAEARAAIPALLESVDRFESIEAVDRIRELDPHLLVERVKAKNLTALNEVARALGELGPAMAEAVPHLRQLLDETPANYADLGRTHALDEAIHRIDPTQPKLLYKFEDLHEAAAALVEAIYSQDKVRSPIYDTYIRDFQDHNAVSRGQLLRFLETTKADPALHQIFVAKLLERNPGLAADLQGR